MIKKSRSQLWREQHPDYMRRWREQYHKENPWRMTYDNAKERCKSHRAYGKRGIKFLMTLEDFKYLWFRDKAYEMKQPSIDRKDTLGHYELSNCRYIELNDNVKGPKGWTATGWIKHGACIDCGTKERKHWATGRCKICYERIQREKRKKSTCHK